HEEASDTYQAHGRSHRDDCKDIPSCSACHGTHKILPSYEVESSVNSTNLAGTCGNCHENIDLVKQYDILLKHPVEVYETSVHGKATGGGNEEAATCNDCHSTGGSAHEIYPPNNPASSINHLNIPETCGKCHKEAAKEYWEGIHGKLAKRGMANAPVCTDCHGEHGIIAPDDPRSPVSKHRVAAATCEPCHESTALNERLGSSGGAVGNYIDSYHGLKSQAGDVHVANCESCHGAHRILPSTDSTSTIHPNNLATTCGECHPGISDELAAVTIHGTGDHDPRAPLAVLIEKIYILLIAVVIGGMFLHTLLDYLKQVRVQMKRPSIKRMTTLEVVQHAGLLISFFTLVISGFSLRFNESWIATFFFGWEGGFELRGVIHRYAAVVMIIVSLWHFFFLFTKRGKQLFQDMLPSLRDLREAWGMILYFFDKRSHEPAFGRFAYGEKLEYWAGLWGNIVMIATGLLLWFDNYVIHMFSWSDDLLDVALVVHYWEAWLATLAILIWHLYNTVFRPSSSPMNTSWLTGNMPRAMFDHEHAGTVPDPDINSEDED
ncbi:MAG: cytochrome B, partial [Candidatus Marinimicrobia bacterium]|nr:cytochrome B [Candidatus Neomarinimicrobiota bacterium]